MPFASLRSVPAWSRLCLALAVAGAAALAGCQRNDHTPPVTNQPPLRDQPGSEPATPPDAAPIALQPPALPSDPATPSEGNRSPAQGDPAPVPSPTQGERAAVNPAGVSTSVPPLTAPGTADAGASGAQAGSQAPEGAGTSIPQATGTTPSSSGAAGTAPGDPQAAGAAPGGVPASGAQ